MDECTKTDTPNQPPTTKSVLPDDPALFPERKRQITPQSKILGITKSKTKPVDEAKEREQQAQGRAELQKRIMERRKLGLHYITKAQLRLRQMEESIKNQQVHSHKLAVPLDPTVMEVTRDRETKKVEEIEEMLQKHIDGIQTLCAKLKN